MSEVARQNGQVSAADGHRRSLLARVAGAATERIVDTVDPDIVLDHVDVDALVARIDVNALLERVDLDRLVERMDVKALVERAGVPEMVAASTGHLAESGLDAARRQVVGLDMVLARATDRLLRRPPRTEEDVPPRIAASAAQSPGQRLSVSGHYAGPVSRCLAAALDVALVTATWTLALAAGDYLLSTVGLGPPDVSGWWSVVGICLWGFAYVWAFVAVVGRTPGKALLGLRVVRADGSFVPVGRSFVRALLWWFSVFIAWLAVVPVVLGWRHRAVHDVLAGTAVVHDWGDRPAELSAPLSAFLRRSGQGDR
jgi:uncharacterized RDD family membrane protein YckC